MRCRLPRGLGSSAATIAAGVLAGLAWQGDDRDPFPLAVELEGHPDNVAAALFGGVQLSWKSSRGPRTVALGPAPVEFVAVIPPYELSTEQARAAIPPQVPLFDAVYTAARAALLVAAIEQGRPELLADALDDRLHEPYRAPLVPLLAAVRAAPARSPRARSDAVGRRADGACVGRAGIGHRRGRRAAGTRGLRGAAVAWSAADGAGIDSLDSSHQLRDGVGANLRLTSVWTRARRPPAHDGASVQPARSRAPSKGSMG